MLLATSPPARDDRIDMAWPH